MKAVDALMILAGLAVAITSMYALHGLLRYVLATAGVVLFFTSTMRAVARVKQK